FLYRALPRTTPPHSRETRNPAPPRTSRASSPHRLHTDAPRFVPASRSDDGSQTSPVRSQTVPSLPPSSSAPALPATAYHSHTPPQRSSTARFRTAPSLLDSVSIAHILRHPRSPATPYPHS